MGGRPFSCLFLGEGDLHGVCRCDLEALKSVLGSTGLDFILKLNEGDVMSSGYQPHLFEAWEPGGREDVVLKIYFDELRLYS